MMNRFGIASIMGMIGYSCFCAINPWLHTVVVLIALHSLHTDRTLYQPFVCSLMIQPVCCWWLKKHGNISQRSSSSFTSKQTFNRFHSVH